MRSSTSLGSSAGPVALRPIDRANEHIYTDGGWHDELLWELVLDSRPSDQEAR